jgi:hypothetical protein
MGYSAIAKRCATGAIADENGMFGTRNLFVVYRQWLHQGHGVDALLVADAPQVVERQAGERHNGSSVERCVVKAIHQMNGAGPSCADANPETSGVLAKPHAMKAAASS